MAEKRKRDQRREFQWWLLLAGFVLGVPVLMTVTQFVKDRAAIEPEQNNPFYLTATQAYIDSAAYWTPEATKTATYNLQSLFQSATQAHINSTATAAFQTVFVMATQMSNDATETYENDPYLLTWAQLIKIATANWSPGPTDTAWPLFWFGDSTEAMPTATPTATATLSSP